MFRYSPRFASFDLLDLWYVPVSVAVGQSHLLGHALCLRGDLAAGDRGDVYRQQRASQDRAASNIEARRNGRLVLYPRCVDEEVR